MIEGAAPPLEHKENHEPDGSDPLILPGDISSDQLIKWDGDKFIGVAEPSGGLASRYDDNNFFYNSLFRSIDGFCSYLGGGGGFDWNPERLLMSTSTGSGSTVDLYTWVQFPLPLLTWDKIRKLKTRVRFNPWTNKYGEFWVCIGRYDYTNCIAFYVDDGVLYGLNRAGGSESTVALETLGTGTFDETRDLEIVLTPGTKTEFYVDGILIDELTDDVPSGTTHAEYPFDLTVKNLSNAKQMYLYISQLSMYQAA